MRVTTNFTKTIITFCFMQLFIISFLLFIFFGEGEVEGSVTMGVLVAAIISVVCAVTPYFIIRSNRATLTVRDNLLEYRQGEYVPEEYNINNLVNAVKIEIHRKETTRSGGKTTTTYSKECFLVLTDNDNNAYRIPSDYFKYDDLDIILKEMVSVNWKLNVNDYKVKKIRDGNFKMNHLLEKIINR